MKRNLIAAAVLLTVLATAACEGKDVAAKATSTMSLATLSPTTSPTPAIDPKAQPAVNAYLHYMFASNLAQRNPTAHGDISQDVPLGGNYTKYSFDPERSEFSVVIHQLWSQGLRMVGDPGQPRPKVRSMDLVGKPFPIVVLTDCPTPAVNRAALDVKTGKTATVPPPAGTVPAPYRTTVQVINDKNHWGVAKITTDSGRTCSR